MTEIRIINESGNELPAYATPGAAGMDLRAWLPEGPVTLAPLERKLIATGIRLEIPAGFECQIRPRSGLALKHGVTVLNTPGTIDSDYRGYVGVILVNLGSEPFRVESGERICQMVFVRVEQVFLRSADTLSDTERGEGGFGHSGTR
ncbi:MAG: dUTP diphosphatase [Muribaculaceae bacterium]|nr:dUTP diphosphatase [Muribaculaceae bacterium]